MIMIRVNAFIALSPRARWQSYRTYLLTEFSCLESNTAGNLVVGIGIRTSISWPVLNEILATFFILFASPDLGLYVVVLHPVHISKRVALK